MSLTCSSLFRILPDTDGQCSISGEYCTGNSSISFSDASLYMVSPGTERNQKFPPLSNGIYPCIMALIPRTTDTCPVTRIFPVHLLPDHCNCPVDLSRYHPESRSTPVFVAVFPFITSGCDRIMVCHLPVPL